MTKKCELCMLIAANDRVLWADVGDGPASIADSRKRWEMIWRLREELVEVTHSHPIGPLAFSHEDETTMDALDGALGRRLRYSVVAPSGMIARDRDGAKAERVEREPWWARILRLASGMEQEV